ncbi:hypothetical protein TRAPUB_840 [Trametes pubescens]|uniref:Uncharacterized protein n=1 Tax=Trametes pubescens TaxID=154538 RepID=A0A1M2VL02_TRAPU|nr:hypothetical protein TRAPUB_840 [Trametes pubescens]
MFLDTEERLKMPSVGSHVKRARQMEVPDFGKDLPRRPAPQSLSEGGRNRGREKWLHPFDDVEGTRAVAGHG